MMTVAWLLYVVVVGGLVSLAARGADSALRAGRRPTRWAWLTAGSITALAGLAPLARAFPNPHGRAPAGSTAVESVGAPGAVRVLPWIPQLTPPMSEASAADRVARALRWRLPHGAGLTWGLATLALWVWLAGSVWHTARRRRRWSPATVMEQAVRLSADTGPAVVGLLRGEIVLPRRLLALNPESLRAVLHHEEEHRRAHDLAVVAGFLLLLTLVPWNPWLWWQLRRLRLAVEADCDARTLAGLRGMDARAYGRLLLSAASRGRNRTPLLAAALGDPAWALERRIRYLLPGGSSGRTFVVGIALTIVGILAACGVPTPTTPLTEVAGDAPAGPPTLTATPWSDAGVFMRMGSDILLELWGGEPDAVRGAAALALELAPDGALRTVRVDAVSGGAEVAHAATAVVRKAAFSWKDGDNREASGPWIPVWIVLSESGVTTTLVSSDLYGQVAAAGGSAPRAYLRRLLETYAALQDAPSADTPPILEGFDFSGVGVFRDRRQVAAEVGGLESAWPFHATLATRRVPAGGR